MKVASTNRPSCTTNAESCARQWVNPEPVVLQAFTQLPTRVPLSWGHRDLQIIDVYLARTIQVQRRAEAAQAQLVKSDAPRPGARLEFWTWTPLAVNTGLPYLDLQGVVT